MHGYAKTICTRLGNMGAIKVLTIPKYRVPIILHNEDYNPPKAPGIYARHKTARNPSKISIWLIDTLAKKWLHPQTRRTKRKRTAPHEQKPYAKYLALALLVSIRNGGHNVTATSWAEGYDLSPDNAANRTANSHNEIHRTQV